MRKFLAKVDWQGKDPKTESEILLLARADCIVNSAMIITELQEEKEALKNELIGMRKSLEEARRNWKNLRQETKNMPEGQADILVDSAMIMTELQKAKSALEVEIIERKNVEERLYYRAFHDTLTALPNRAMLIDRLEYCIKRIKRSQGYLFAVLYMDIDNFKIINDSFGHRIGDELLVEVSERLTEGLRELDTIVRIEENVTARMGGDEFIVLLDGIRTPEDAVLVTKRIQKQMSSAFKLKDHEFVISVSIGIALSGEDCKNTEELLRNADTAMYQAKKKGKAQYITYDKSMHVQILNRLTLENDLRVALEKKQFYILYQPIISLKSGKIVALEALIRWNHPSRGIVSPLDFIPIAEETGMIVPIGRWVLYEACRQLCLWNDKRSPSQAISINVNVSKKQLVDSKFITDVKQILIDTGVKDHHLNLEITESMILEASDSIGQKLKKLKKLGVCLHMDDFGTGYSSLSCLHRFPLDLLKIDRQFIKTITSRGGYAPIISAIITLARNMNMKITSEGVETEEQLSQLMELDSDYAQGFYFSKPVDSSEVSGMLKSEKNFLNFQANTNNG